VLLIYYLLISLGSLSKALPAIIESYGYASVVLLMALESASLPLPSEVILPTVGFLVSKGLMDFYIALIAALIGNFIGIMVDYYIGYYLGKDFIYKNLRLFHVKKETLDNFDSWFDKNGEIAVFFSRMIPVIRGLISFPAGFANMNKKKFITYSMVGSLIYDALLILFGMYALSVGNIVELMAAISIFAVILIAVYKAFMHYLAKSK